MEQPEWEVAGFSQRDWLDAYQDQLGVQSDLRRAFAMPGAKGAFGHVSPDALLRLAKLSEEHAVKVRQLLADRPPRWLAQAEAASPPPPAWVALLRYLNEA